jgi:HEAT repeat protein
MAARPGRLVVVVAGGIALLVVSLIITTGRIRRRGRHEAEAEAGGAASRRAAWSTFSEAAEARTSPETSEDAAKAVAATVTLWRNGVLQRDAETVLRLDMTFREAPDRYVTALAESAKSDPDGRVRAFSTRMLGKLERADLAELFSGLLSDQNPYVRKNAAWALGELAGAADGRSAARSALAVLKHVRARDPDAAVRTAAGGALDRLE